jgi:hypothetical protein
MIYPGTVNDHTDPQRPEYPPPGEHCLCPVTPNGYFDSDRNTRMGEIDPTTVFPNERTLDLVASGEMTQIHRGNQYAEEGDVFEIDGEQFEVVDVAERTLGDLTDEDAKREGSADLEAYKQRMVRAHGGEFTWDESADVVRHRVARVE